MKLVSFVSVGAIGYVMTPPHPPKAGDEVVCEIMPIGRLVTWIVGR